MVDEIRRRSRDRSDSLSFYWIASAAVRDEFAREIREQSPDLPICPIVVRTQGFENPNAVAEDLLRALDTESVRLELCRANLAERMRAARRVDIVLIARRELELESSSSPLVLPEWFPLWPSELVTATISDLTWSTHISLDAEDVRVGDIARLVFDLDRELARRLRASHERDHRLVNSFVDLLKKDGEGPSFTRLLSDAEAVLERVTNPRGYRPRISRRTSLVGRIWLLANTTPPDGLRRAAKGLVSALDLPAGVGRDAHEGIVTVLSRPSSPITDPRQRWSFNLIVTLRAACQLITAAAHADEYSAYPLPLVRSMSRDIRASLDNAVERLAAD